MKEKCMSVCFTALSALAMYITFASIVRLWILTSILHAILTLVGAFFVWMVCCRWIRRRLGIAASAPTFVFVSIFIFWGLYIFLLRKDVGPAMDVVFNTQYFLLTIGLWRMLLSDPGYVQYENISLESPDPTMFSATGSDQPNFMDHCTATGTNIQTSYDCRLFMRARYCNKCQVYVNRFDHHCPAFGNCVGQKNHQLFILLLIAFVSAEMCYFISGISWFSCLKNYWEGQPQTSLLVPCVISTSMFAIIQVFWQVPFLFWHLYCISLNITTDEWVNWDKYPEFQLAMPPEPGRPFPGRKFKNPYNKGVIQNIVTFFKSRA